jgi:hypothetical protein
MALRGRVTLDAASSLDRVLSDPAVQGPHSRSTWVYWAKTESARRLRNRVESRLRELRTGERVHETTLHLTSKGRDDLERSCVVLGDRARRSFSESEAVEVLADYFLEREDSRRKARGTRRVGDTLVNRSRAIPAEVERAVRARSGNRCEVPF